MKTSNHLIEQVSKALGNGTVIHHIPTKDNLIGQSGVHTFVSDIMDVIENINGPVKDPGETFKALIKLIIKD
jgi:hypothetical protein